MMICKHCGKPIARSEYDSDWYHPVESSETRFAYCANVPNWDNEDLWVQGVAAEPLEMNDILKAIKNVSGI